MQMQNVSIQIGAIVIVMKIILQMNVENVGVVVYCKIVVVAKKVLKILTEILFMGYGKISVVVDKMIHKKARIEVIVNNSRPQIRERPASGSA